ncbi:MAG: DivIVA domain-containing protein [Actinomycetes bacterium]
MPLTPEDVANKRFTSTRFRPGYDEDEVDAFLDEVEAELTRLLQENKTLAARAVGVPTAPPPAAAVLETAAPPEPEGSQDAALRTLLLAQRTADEAIAQARKEAEQIVVEARTRASSLEQEAQQQHATAMAELERRRRDLERQVGDLRAFEREYRTRLRAYLETQLRELSTRGVGGDGPVPASTPAASTPPAGAAPQVPPAAAAPPATAPPAPTTARAPSPFAPAPTFTRPEGEPSGPPREAGPAEAVAADAPPGMEVDEGPEVPPSAG